MTTNRTPSGSNPVLNLARKETAHRHVCGSAGAKLCTFLLGFSLAVIGQHWLNRLAIIQTAQKGVSHNSMNDIQHQPMLTSASSMTM